MSALTRILRAPIGWLFGVLIVAALQTAALAWMIVDRAMILRDGVEIVLRPEPVDPRDLFRGDYVVLRYAIASPPVDRVPENGETVWAVLTRDDAGGWRRRAMTTTRPSQIGDSEVVLRGRFQSGRALFGIERYYVPEGEGGRLERSIGNGSLTVVVAVDATGRAAIKRLLLDGAAIYEEPPY